MLGGVSFVLWKDNRTLDKQNNARAQSQDTGVRRKLGNWFAPSERTAKQREMFSCNGFPTHSMPPTRRQVLNATLFCCFVRIALLVWQGSYLGYLLT